MVERRHACRAVAAPRAVERTAAWAGLKSTRRRVAARTRAVSVAALGLARVDLAGRAQDGAAAVDAAAEGLGLERAAAAGHYGAEGGTMAVGEEEAAARSGGSRGSAAAAGVGRGVEAEGVVVLGEDGLGKAVSWSP